MTPVTCSLYYNISVYRTQYALQHSLGIQARARLPVQGHRVHYLSNWPLRLCFPAGLPAVRPAILPQVIVQMLQHLCRLLIVADPKQLDPHLPGGSVAFITSTCRGNDHGLYVAYRPPVGDDDDIEVLDFLLTLCLQLAQIRAQDCVQTNADKCSTRRPHKIENGPNICGDERL